MTAGPLSAPAASASLQEWLTYLESIHPQSIDMGLERVARVAASADVLEPAPLVITVSGTNGKGSTVCYLETILQTAGYTTGVYTSPHIVEYRERVRINGQELTNSAHTEAFAVIEKARKNTSLTYFEFGTLAALWLMKANKPDVVILEVGLGGRLDAVNCVDADVAVITSIGIDHIAFLGNNREQIGREKAGIARTDKPLICGEASPTASIAETAASVGAKLWQVGRDFHRNEKADSWSYRSQHTQLNDLPLPKLPIINASTAIAAIEQLPLPVTLSAIREGIAKAALPGRMQTDSYKNCEILLDVAHNPQAAAYACQYLDKFYPKHKVFAVVGMLSDKDHSGVVKALSSRVCDWYLGSLSEPRGETSGQLAVKAKLPNESCHLFDSVEHAFCEAVQAAEQYQANNGKALVFGFGSFYTVARITAHLKGV
ncbi:MULTISPECIES: bifunctional tetrahydrofolate synthase/dihydrofolate synthase [Idiomarina]|uniref:bifunctional tetrahydrofolate synthase/dihydrofolate synthase n=1 Tax=Idiomarina TaxID=135575 RepID=UPI000C667EC7|nr:MULTISPECIES: bifunctional tetrahydrofolate synthase/dihydrofolate synthase [Idiomarina]MBP57522.1 bifunctional tetrahydrofolate synthase/dihydrofolate synthase [Idiomarina sp.]|tara:strand:- start:16595 stop:17887 length:1293 start_codon:yes stop_codon:yes gene_type:complete